MLSKETNPTVYDIATTISNSLVIAQEVNKHTKFLDDKNVTSIYVSMYYVEHGYYFELEISNYQVHIKLVRWAPRHS